MTLLDKANIVYLWQDLFRYSNQQWTVLTIITWTRPLGWRRNASSTCWTAFSSQRRSQPLWPSWRRHFLRFVWKTIEVNDQNLYIQMEGSRVPHSKVGFSSNNQLVAEVGFFMISLGPFFVFRTWGQFLCLLVLQYRVKIRRFSMATQMCSRNSGQETRGARGCFWVPLVSQTALLQTACRDSLTIDNTKNTRM